MSSDDRASDPRLERLADEAWLLHVEGDNALACNRRVHAIAEQLEQSRRVGVVDIVPAYASLAVFFDYALVDAEDISQWLLQCTAVLHEATRHDESPLIEIPVHYGGASGPDLAAAASELGIDSDELIARHTAPEYTVAMIGFAPGFPYLLGMDERIALPRLATPRTRVPAGSVGIGGAQTGIYPSDSPGGWRILGRTPLMLFAPTRAQPSLLQPGDRVRFVAVSADTDAAAT